MYRTLLVGVWLSSGRSNVKVPHLAWCEYGVRSQWRWHIAFANELLKFAEPHVASNVRYIAFSMIQVSPIAADL